MKRAWLVGMIVLLGAVGAQAGPEHEDMPAPPKASEALERIEALAGRWEGTTDHGHGNGKTEPVVVEYKVTSGGSAVVETLNPGGDHEMVSVYHDEGNRLAMTHYCMLGNEPVLQLTNATSSEMTFALDGSRGIGSPQEMHMHGLTLAWADPDHLTQTWTSYSEGQPVGTTTFSVTRKR
jgi:hypothetical protein